MLVGEGGYERDVEELAGIVLDSWEEEECGVVGVFFDDGEDLGGGEGGGGWSGGDGY